MHIISKINLVLILPWLVFVSSLGVTFQLWNNAKQRAMWELQFEFDSRVLDASSRIKQRMLNYELMLDGVRCLFAASRSVERDEFHTYVNALHIDKNFPGVQSVGFTQIVPAAKKHEHIAAIRREGFPTYTIKPEGERDFYAPVVYVEPFSGRNLRVFGYDHSFDSKNRALINLARDLDRTVVTRKVQLAQEIGEYVQAGFLMAKPVYKNGAALNTVADHRTNFLGLVGSSFRMNDLMAGILGKNIVDLDIEIYDGEEMSEQTLMYDADNIRRDGGKSSSLLQAVNRIKITDHTWTMLVSSLPEFESRLDRGTQLYNAVAGIGVSILLTLLTWLLLYSRARSLRAALEVSDNKAELLAILDHLPIGVWLSGLDGRYSFVNNVFCDAIGKSKSEFLAANQLADVLGPELAAKYMRSDRQCLELDVPYTFRATHMFVDGLPHLLTITKAKLIDTSGVVTGVIGISQDITESVLLQEALQRSWDELETKVGQRTQALNATTNKLKKEVQTRKELERNVLEISEGEQARIGRELHDDLGQLLTGTAYLAGILSSKLAKTDPVSSQQAEEIKKITQGAIKRTRYISHGLIGFYISTKELKLALQQLAQDVSNLSEIPCEFRSSSDAEISDTRIATNLYRIAQEAVNNAVKHSLAKKLMIYLSVSKNEIRLVIEDDGVGFSNVLASSENHGLMSMNYRAQLIGAAISVVGQEGLGTKVTLILALHDTTTTS